MQSRWNTKPHRKLGHCQHNRKPDRGCPGRQTTRGPQPQKTLFLKPLRGENRACPPNPGPATVGGCQVEDKRCLLEAEAPRRGETSQSQLRSLGEFCKAAAGPGPSAAWGFCGFPMPADLSHSSFLFLPFVFLCSLSSSKKCSVLFRLPTGLLFPFAAYLHLIWLLIFAQL